MVIFIVAASLLLANAAGPAGAQAPTAGANPQSQNAPAGDQNSQSASSGAADQSSRPKERFHLPPVGIDVGAYLPLDGSARRRFGDSWTSIGIGIGGLRQPTVAGRLSPDINLISQSDGDDHIYIAPIGLDYRRAFTEDELKPGHAFAPYFGGTLDIVGVYLRAPEENVRWGTHGAAGGSVFVGTDIGKTGYVEARYVAITSVAGFGLSGLNFTAGIRF